jgi:hypothetical protein
MPELLKFVCETILKSVSVELINPPGKLEIEFALMAALTVPLLAGAASKVPALVRAPLIFKLEFAANLSSTVTLRGIIKFDNPLVLAKLTFAIPPEAAPAEFNNSVWEPELIIWLTASASAGVNLLAAVIGRLCPPTLIDAARRLLILDALIDFEVEDRFKLLFATGAAAA